MIKHHLHLLRITRNNALNWTEELTIAQLNMVSTGFNNNIIWNLGHMLVTQQLLCYRLSGVDCVIDEALIEKYKKGTHPKGIVSLEETTFIKQALLTTLDTTSVDWNAKLFKTYTPYTTSYGNTITSFEEAVVFNNIHEGLHLGYIMALKKNSI